MAVSELGYKTLVGTERAISAINGLRDKSAYLVGPPVPEFKTRLSATAGWHFQRDLTRRLRIGGCGQSHVFFFPK